MVKRYMDIILSGFGIIFISPLLLLMSFLVYLAMGRPIFFKQASPGLGGDIFNLLKFRTMTNACDKNGQLLPDDLRLTKLGRFMRKSSIDELPSLFSVFIGDMSIVGPRPLLVRYLDRYSSEQVRRHDVTPGITGWAQVNGRNAISWGEKFELDIWYVDNRTIWLDIKIMLLTIKKVLMRENINQDGHATMPEFMGDH